MATNQEDLPLSTSDESAASAPQLQPRRPETHVIWPGNVPTQEQALQVLRGTLKLAMSLPTARKLQDTLTHPERQALQEPGTADALSEALAVRWRLAAARDLWLTAEGKVDPVALNALMAEAERLMEELRTSEPASPELALAVDRTWETLAQEAIDFSENIRELSAQAHAQAHAQAQAQAHAQAQAQAQAHAAPKKATASKVTFEKEEPAQQQQQRAKKLVLLALALVLVAVGGFKVFSLLQPPRYASNHTGAPPNTLVTSDKRTGAMTVRSMLVGPASEEQQEWLQQLETSGMQVKELSPGSWLVTPASGTSPATADNTTP